jgi:hypothetical protein
MSTQRAWSVPISGTRGGAGPHSARRAISEDVARAQRLGYANGRTLLSWLTGRNDSGEDLLPVAVQLGLVLERPAAEDDHPAYREFFFDRLIVPELRHGWPMWCIGRAVEDEVEPPVVDDACAPAPTLHIGTSVPAAESPPAPTSSSGSSRRPRPKCLGLPGEKPVMGLEHVQGRRAAFIAEAPFDMLAAIGWGRFRRYNGSDKQWCCGAPRSN